MNNNLSNSELNIQFTVNIIFNSFELEHKFNSVIISSLSTYFFRDLKEQLEDLHNRATNEVWRIDEYEK